MTKLTPFILVCLIFISCETENDSDSETMLMSSGRNGNSDIFLMDTKGESRGLVALTDQDSEEWSPTWISQYEISFLRQIGDSIFRVGLNVETGDEFELDHPLNCVLDDKNILYAPQSRLQLYSCLNNIYIYDPSTGVTDNLTEDLEGVSNYPAWGNGFRSVVFTSNHRGTNDIYQLHLDSDEMTQLTDSDANSERGDLSPDGELLVYSSDYFENGNQDILIKELVLGEITNISNSEGTELIARFSTNGQTTFYGSNKDGNWEIYSYNISTSVTSRLSEHEAFDGDPRVLRME